MRRCRVWQPRRHRSRLSQAGRASRAAKTLACRRRGVGRPWFEAALRGTAERHAGGASRRECLQNVLEGSSSRVTSGPDCDFLCSRTVSPTVIVLQEHFNKPACPQRQQAAHTHRQKELGLYLGLKSGKQSVRWAVRCAPSRKCGRRMRLPSSHSPANVCFGCLLSLCSFSFVSVLVQMKGCRQILHCGARCEERRP